MAKWTRAASGARLPRGLVEAVARASTYIERHHCWGLAPWGVSTRFRVHLVPLGDLGLFAEHDLDARAFPSHVPFARLENEPSFLVVSTLAPYAVSLWDAGDRRLHTIWDSLDTFLGRLLERGERSPGERLESSLERASSHVAAGRHADTITLLEPLAQRLDPSMHEEQQAIRLHNLLGLAYKASGRTADARAAFERAAKLGDTYCDLNLLDLLTDDAPDPRAVIAHAQIIRNKPFDEHGRIWLARYLAQAYLDLGEPTKAEAELRSVLASHPDHAELPRVRAALATYAGANKPGSAGARSILTWFAA
jgi:tetratricopeptide (TPR) repeat protein